MNTAALYKHRWTLLRMPLALFAIALASAVWWWWNPMPPTRLTISTGLADGAYPIHASRYAEALARRGIQLDVQLSAGSPQNLERLQARPATADLALVQGGFGWSSAVGPDVPKAPVQTLANVDIEALWLFSQGAPLTTLDQLGGLRVAAGPEGSGHRNLLRRLLAQDRVPPEDIRWSELSGLPAATPCCATKWTRCSWSPHRAPPAWRPCWRHPGCTWRYCRAPARLPNATSTSKAACCPRTPWAPTCPPRTHPC
ncbi:MAG: TAXI family TRAP transporter solute-binding subunit [Hydrogenophaga sp.]|nr:TAXI family TRAP transporter solute-binding subunit [Hydrogenophaga sp.]